MATLLSANDVTSFVSLPSGEKAEAEVSESILASCDLCGNCDAEETGYLNEVFSVCRACRTTLNLKTVKEQKDYDEDQRKRREAAEKFYSSYGSTACSIGFMGGFSGTVCLPRLVVPVDMR